LRNTRYSLGILLLAILVLGILSLLLVGNAQSSRPILELDAHLARGIYLPLVIGGNSTNFPQPDPTATSQLLFESLTPTPTVTVTSTPTSTWIPTKTSTATLTPTATPTPPDPAISFAVIGDYGSGNSDAGDVARLIDTWNVDFVITTGDNNYPDGEASTIDANIGQFYHSYIFPYTGSYGSGADRNYFFPSLGNHDWYTTGAQPYLDYFCLPGNERYYDFVWGPVHFFILDSDYHEPDGRAVTSTQAQWLQRQMVQSTSSWNVIYMHEPPYASGPHGGTEIMQWPYRDWGADIVLSGHEHNYERLLSDGLTYVVNGLGGDSMDPFQNPLPYGPDDPVKSLVRYNGDFGAMKFEVNSSQLSFSFINRSNTAIDSFSLNH
jgi:hypothetical protein